MSVLSDNLKRKMRELGWKAKPLSREAGLNDYVVHNILRGSSKKPSADKVDALARVLGVSSAYLLYGDPDPELVPEFAKEKIPWDGILYSKAIHLAEAICKKKHIKFSSSVEYKKKIMQYAQKIYLYAIKKGDNFADEVFAEMIIEEVYE